jgi:flagellar motor switch protein FliG
MTTLNKLKTMGDPEIQNWLKKVGKDDVNTMVYALLGADEEVKNCVFRNMSERASAVLKIELTEYGASNIPENRIISSAEKLEQMF